MSLQYDIYKSVGANSQKTKHTSSGERRIRKEKEGRLILSNDLAIAV